MIPFTHLSQRLNWVLCKFNFSTWLTSCALILHYLLPQVCLVNTVGFKQLLFILNFVKQKI